MTEICLKDAEGLTEGETAGVEDDRCLGLGSRKLITEFRLGLELNKSNPSKF